MEVSAWIEISLIVDGELAEAVAEVLSRYISDGVVIESTQIKQETDGAGSVEGPLRVCGYIPVNERLDAAKQQIEKALWFLGRIQPLPQAQYRPIQAQNWMEAWKEHYNPLEIGNQILILPAWFDAPDTSRHIIRINPGMAFGTGTHPTTQLCLELLETWLPAGQPVLDVGCGSGILSIAAVQLGASVSYGVDIDSQALEFAQENLVINKMEQQVQFAVGSVETIQDGQFPIKTAPLVLANILAPILVKLMDAGLGKLVAAGGHLILSGIMEDHLPDIYAALSRNNLEIIGRQIQGDWIALVVQPA